MTRNLNENFPRTRNALNIPLDRQTNAAVNGQKIRTIIVSASVRRTAVAESGGLGLARQCGIQQSGQLQPAGAAAAGNSVGQWDVGVQNARINGEDYSTAVGSARGSLVLMNRGLFAMRQSLNSFAVVSTAGVADIPVRLENLLWARPTAKACC